MTGGGDELQTRDFSSNNVLICGAYICRINKLPINTLKMSWNYNLMTVCYGE